MGDPAGRMIMACYRELVDFKHQRGGAYVVLACAKLGQWDKARHFADALKNYQPRIGYEYALRDIIDYVNALTPPRN